MTYGAGIILIGELKFEFDIKENFASSIASVTPTNVLSN